MNWLQRQLNPTCHNNKWFRKWVGGYWESWHISIIHCDLWFHITKEMAFSGIADKEDAYMPGCGNGTPYCEYYPINFFDVKTKLSKKELLRLERKVKLERL